MVEEIIQPIGVFDFNRLGVELVQQEGAHLSVGQPRDQRICGLWRQWVGQDRCGVDYGCTGREEGLRVGWRVCADGQKGGEC